MKVEVKKNTRREFMKKLSGKKFALMAACGFIFILGIAKTFSQVPSSQPGTQDDPLITKSYAEKFYGWRLETLSPGNYVLMKTGCEAVVRSGKAVVAGGEIVSLTRGASLVPGMSAAPNHELLSPKGDGRGIKIYSTAYVLLRGDCNVE